MSSLSTKSIKVESSNESKTLDPGTHIVKINKIFLDQPSFLEEQKGYYVKLEVEGEKIEGFEGFLIDKDDESKGRYEGKVATIRSSQYSYYDHNVNGIDYSRDLEIMKFIGKISHAVGSDWFEQADGKYATIEKFVEAFNKEKPFKDKFIKMCIGGREYENQKGYTAYDMFIVKGEKGSKPFGTTNEKVIEFNESKHIVKSKTTKPKEVTLDTTDDDPLGNVQYDFNFEN